MENKKEQIKNLTCKMAMNRLLIFEIEKENKCRDETKMIMEMKIKTQVKAERNKGKKSELQKIRNKECNKM